MEFILKLAKKGYIVKVYDSISLSSFCVIISKGDDFYKMITGKTQAEIESEIYKLYLEVE